MDRTSAWSNVRQGIEEKRGLLVKTLALLAVGAMVLAGATLTLAAPTHPQAGVSAISMKSALSLRLPSISHIRTRWGVLPLQTNSTPQPTTTATATPATPGPTVTPTTGQYPDPTAIFNNMLQEYGLINTARFEYVTDGTQTNIVSLHIDGVGDATCKGPALTMKVTAKQTLQGTQQTQKYSGNFVQVKNTTWEYSKRTSNKWKKVNENNVTVLSFPFPIQNPLLCPNSSSGSSSSGGSSGGTPSDQFKDLVNLGPETFQGNAVWHLHLTDVHVDTGGTVTNIPIDLLIGQAHYFPYVFQQTLSDPQDNITIVEKQILTKFGEKVTVKKPKTGSSKKP
jgi:hypothetical protein